jgi:hypothetical protein
MQTLSRQPVTVKALIEALFDALGDAGEREGNRFVTASDYGSSPIVIDVQDVALELLERFDVIEPKAPSDGT